jgi:GNAT superfamily N-acetyltransferase
VIRVATEADSQLVQQHWQAFNAEVPDLPWREDDAADFRPDVALLADEDGLAALTRQGERAWFVDVVYVRPEARGRGLGTELLRAAAEQVGEGATLELEVLESNEGARRLYERLGFATVERTLAAPVSALLAARPDGPSYGAVHVQTDDADAVRRDAAKVLHAVSAVELTGSWVRVETEPDRLRMLARELSYTNGVALALSVESGAVVRYILFDRGSMVDEYASLPEFHGSLPPGDVIALGANPTVVARLTGADPARVRAVARTASSPADLPPAQELYASIAAVLGLEVG